MNPTPNALGSGNSLLPCKECGTPTPAIELPGDGRVVRVAAHCDLCTAAMFADVPQIDPTIEQHTKTCKGCAQPFQAPITRILGRVLDPVLFCEACSAKNDTSRMSAKQKAFLEACRLEWESICPAFYRTDEITAALPKDKLDAVKAALKAGPGVLIHGGSGKFKTTAMFHAAVKRIIFSRKSVRYVIASEWKPACSHAAKETTTLAFLRPFISCDYLFLDDLGNMAGTPASEEALHLLTEKRMQNHRPMLITTQYTGATLAARFKTPEIADAILRRIGLLTGTTIAFK